MLLIQSLTFAIVNEGNAYGDNEESAPLPPKLVRSCPRPSGSPRQSASHLTGARPAVSPPRRVSARPAMNALPQALAGLPLSAGPHGGGADDPAGGAWAAIRATAARGGTRRAATEACQRQQC